MVADLQGNSARLQALTVSPDTCAGPTLGVVMPILLWTPRFAREGEEAKPGATNGGAS